MVESDLKDSKTLGGKYEQRKVKLYIPKKAKSDRNTLPRKVVL